MTELQQKIKDSCELMFKICQFDFDKLAAQSERSINLGTYHIDEHLIKCAKRLREEQYEIAAYHCESAFNHFTSSMKLTNIFDKEGAYEATLAALQNMKILKDANLEQVVTDSKVAVANSYHTKDLYNCTVEELVKHVDLRDISDIIDIAVQGHMIHCYVVDGTLQDLNITLDKVQWLQSLVVTTNLSATITGLRNIPRAQGVTKIVPILHLNESIKLYSYFIIAVITDDNIAFICDNEEFANPHAANTTRNPYRRREDNFEKLLYPYYLLNNEEFNKYSNLPVALDADFVTFTVPMKELYPDCTLFFQLTVSIFVDLLHKDVIDVKLTQSLESHLQTLALPAPTGLSNSSLYNEIHKNDRGVAEHIKELE